MKTEKYGEEEAKSERRQMFYKLNMVPWLLLVATFCGIIYILLTNRNSLNPNVIEKGNLNKPPIGGLFTDTGNSPQNETKGVTIEPKVKEGVGVTNEDSRTNVVTIVFNDLKLENKALVDKLALTELRLKEVGLEYKGLQEEIVKKEYGKWEKKDTETKLVLIDTHTIYQRTEVDLWKIKDIILEMEKTKKEGEKLLEGYRWVFAMNTVTNTAGVTRFKYTPEDHTYARSIGLDLEMDIIDNIKAICDNEGIKTSVTMLITDIVKKSFRGFEIRNNIKKGK